MAIDYFELPRKDWHDSEGRIYKDRLIENFNAIETKLQSIREADGADVTEIDFDSISIPDTTLESSDNKIVNLNSFMNIMHLNDGYPMQLVFNGTKVELVKYFHDGKITTLRDVELSNVKNGVFLWFDSNNGTFEVIDASTATARVADSSFSGHLVAGYSNGKWMGLITPVCCDYDILEPLSRMPVKGVKFTDGLGKGSQTYERSNGVGRKIGSTTVNTKGGSMLELTMPDFGNKKYGQRK